MTLKRILGRTLYLILYALVAVIAFNLFSYVHPIAGLLALIVVLMYGWEASAHPCRRRRRRKETPDAW